MKRETRTYIPQRSTSDKYRLPFHYLFWLQRSKNHMDVNRNWTWPIQPTKKRWSDSFEICCGCFKLCCPPCQPGRWAILSKLEIQWYVSRLSLDQLWASHEATIAHQCGIMVQERATGSQLRRYSRCQSEATSHDRDVFFRTTSHVIATQSAKFDLKLIFWYVDMELA